MKSCTLTLKVNKNTVYSGEFAKEKAALTALENLPSLKDRAYHCAKAYIKNSDVVITKCYYNKDENRDRLGQVSFKHVNGDKAELICWIPFESEADYEAVTKEEVAKLFPDGIPEIKQYRFYFDDNTMAFIQDADEAKKSDPRVRREYAAGMENIVTINGKRYQMYLVPIDDDNQPSTVITKNGEDPRRNQH